MKTLITNYSFDSSEKKITFSDYVSINLEQVLVITNVTDGIVIYNFACPNTGGSVATNVLTLTYDTTSMSDTDDLQIWYDDTTKNASTEEKQDSLLTELQKKADLTETQPVSAVSLPLPSGASTSAKQDTIIGHIDGIESSIDGIESGLSAIETNQTDGTQKTQIVDSLNDNYDIQNPLPTDGDSIYVKDIDLDYSTKVGWTGNIIDLFTCPHDDLGLINDTTTNPKVIYLAFHRTIYLNAIGLGCHITGKTFSNVKFEFIGSDGTVRSTSDYSTDSTKYGTKLFSFAPTVCVAIRISFLTANTDIGLSNITIQKEQAVTSRIRALKPNGIINDIGSTYQGALKTSLNDDLDFVGYNTPIGEIRTIEPVRLVGAGFEGTTIDTKFWTTGASGTGASVTQASAQLLLTSGTSNGASAYAYTVRRARYVSGSSMRFRCIGKLSDTGTVGNKRRWGIGWGATMPTITDGAWFQLDGTEFSVVTCKGGSETKVTSFNGNLGTTYTLTGVVAACEIYYTNSKVWFVMGGQLLHTVTASLDTWTNTLNFHAFKDSLNSGILEASVTMAARTTSVYRLGKMETQPIYYNITGNAATHVLKLGAGILHKIIYNNTAGTSLQIVDNTTGSTPSVGIITTTSTALGVWDYYIPFNTGLTIITVGNGLDATIVYE